MGRFADDLSKKVGAPVKFVDLTQAHAPDNPSHGQTSQSMLGDLREDAAVRDKVAAGDVVVIHTGLNDLDAGSLDAYKAGTCGGSDGADCFRPLAGQWRTNFDAILTEIDKLRDGRPTAIRLVTAEQLFISDPELIAEFGADFGHTTGKLIIDELDSAICAAAEAHHAICIDVRPLLNGPTMDQPSAGENAPETHQAIADQLVASGLAELSIP
jgi:hypothetical protein